MQISDERIHQYQKIYQQRYGIALTFDEAKKQGLQLLNLVHAVYRPINYDEKHEDRGPPNAKN